MFLDEMPDVRSKKQVQLLRVKPGAPIKGILTGNFIRTLVHFYKSKSLPCLESSLNRCPLCRLGINQRYYAYYSIRGASGKAAMLELTATAEATLIDFAKNRPEESAILVTVSRPAGKRNNPIHLEAEFKHCSPENQAALCRVDLDRELMKRSLMHLWNLPDWKNGRSFEDQALIIEKHLEEFINGNV